MSKLSLFCPWWYLMSNPSQSLSQPTNPLLYCLSSFPFEALVGAWHQVSVKPPDNAAIIIFRQYILIIRGMV